MCGFPRRVLSRLVLVYTILLSVMRSNGVIGAGVNIREVVPLMLLRGVRDPVPKGQIVLKDLAPLITVGVLIICYPIARNRDLMFVVVGLTMKVKRGSRKWAKGVEAQHRLELCS